MSEIDDILKLTRRDFLISASRGTGALALASLLQADGLIAGANSKTP